MTVNHKPNTVTRLIAFLIIMMHVTYYANEKENHSLITWAIGDSVVANILKVILVLLAFVLACVTIKFEEAE
jgi:hypothetical protein